MFTVVDYVTIISICIHSGQHGFLLVRWKLLLFALVVVVVVVHNFDDVVQLAVGRRTCRRRWGKHKLGWGKYCCELMVVMGAEWWGGTANTLRAWNRGILWNLFRKM